MTLQNSAYNTALTVFQQAVVAFCAGEFDFGDRLLLDLDSDAIEHDRAQLLDLARRAQPSTNLLAGPKAAKRIPKEVKDAVQRRDRFHCRFTGRRLIEPRVFHEVSRISSVFHFDEHHSVRQSARGPAGHPIVRTHCAAYEHAEAISTGGGTTIDNIYHTSVQLNEAKGAKLLNRVPVPDDKWNGLTEYLDALIAQRSSRSNKAEGRRPVDAQAGSTEPSRMSGVNRIREAATGLKVTVFAMDDPHAEARFLLLRRTRKNEYFANERKAQTWMIHRLYCSSLAFSVPRKLTASPKVCAETQETIREWAARIGVKTLTCSRCRKAK
jgi:hypothetical protein